MRIKPQDTPTSMLVRLTQSERRAVNALAELHGQSTNTFIVQLLRERIDEVTARTHDMAATSRHHTNHEREER